MPNTVSTNSISDEPQIVELMEPANDLQRVYGVDLSLEIFEAVDQNRYRSYVQDFTANGSRHVYASISIAGSENEISRHWLVNKMTELSDERLEIEIIGEYMNIVGRLPGYLPGNNPVFVISAHYDTMPLCPGANDDGSGIAAVLELLGIMSQYEWPLDIYFIAFNGANALFEQLSPIPGLFQGSPEVAEAFTDAGIEILALYNVDTILRPSTHTTTNERLLLVYNDNALSYHVSQYWAELGKTMSNWYGRDVIGAISSSGFIQWYRSDHIKFIANGYDNVILAFESGFNIDTAYQTEYDVWDRSEYTYYLGSETTALIGASMAYTMGKAYGERNRLFNVAVTYPGTSFKQYFPVSMATTLNITARWYGASATFLLYAPGDILIASSSQPAHPWEFTQLFSLPVTQKGLYYLQVWNTGSAPLGIDTYIEYDVDINGNGVSDEFEYWLDSSLFNQDSDSDSISDAMEIIYGTNETKADSDDDAIPDNWELDNGLDPNNSTDASLDFDNDTLTNLQEFSNGLDPNNFDSDSDLLPDGWELANGLDPLVKDADEDPDSDNYTNLQEYLRGSDPQVAEVIEPPYLLWIGVPSTAVVLIGVAIFLKRRE